MGNGFLAEMQRNGGVVTGSLCGWDWPGFEWETKYRRKPAKVRRFKDVLSYRNVLWPEGDKWCLNVLVKAAMPGNYYDIWFRVGI